jgi:triosephosphate isomerase
MARRKIIAGNWKMNKTPSEAVALAVELKPLVANEDVDVVFCVPAIDIVLVAEAVKGSSIKVGAENMYFEESGAYTGEISPAMLVDAGVKYVILGHSERREYFGETNEDVNKKMLKAFEHNITPIMCCGETKLKLQSLPMSLSGQSEQERPLLQLRLRKFAQESAHVSQKFMMKQPQMQSASNTAAP